MLCVHCTSCHINVNEWKCSGGTSVLLQFIFYMLIICFHEACGEKEVSAPIMWPAGRWLWGMCVCVKNWVTAINEALWGDLLLRLQDKHHSPCSAAGGGWWRARLFYIDPGFSRAEWLAVCSPEWNQIFLCSITVATRSWEELSFPSQCQCSSSRQTVTLLSNTTAGGSTSASAQASSPHPHQAGK